MVKLAGMGLIVLCSTMTGIFIASGLSDRVAWMEDCVRLLDFWGDRLRFLQPSVRSLTGDAAGLPQFSRLEFLPACVRGMEAGSPFPESWRSAVEHYSEDKEAAGILVDLDHVLGGMDLESQLTALAYSRELLTKRLEAAREHRERHTRLYRTLGLLGGLALAIILA